MRPTSAINQRPRAGSDAFRNDILAGLRKAPKQLPCKYFYDERGSALFDQICELDEYYLTRTELAIMQQYADEMGQQIGPGVILVEFGSGSSLKTRILLEHLIDPVAYVPVDISREHLHRTARGLARDYPHLEILPVCGDFTKPLELPAAAREPTHAAVYFPGSTIGNFTPQGALMLLKQIGQMCGQGGGLLIGIDLQKDPQVIEAAYNDGQGITDQFNLNLLHRINRTLGADFDLDRFAHRAIYNAEQGRMEIYIESRSQQSVQVDGEKFQFEPGERILTEYSHKYTVPGFAQLAAQAGLALHRHWTDPQAYFGVLHLVATD